MTIGAATTYLQPLRRIRGFRAWHWSDTRIVLVLLLITQGFHTVEHITQVIQYHVLHWSAPASSGLISAFNAEWIHFVWNWTVVTAVVYLVARGMRNRWLWLLLAWSVAHSLEHTYLLVRYLEVTQELRRLGFASVSAQGLPGILGRDGWLARSPLTQSTFICRLPGVTTAPRLDIHFWWNAGETSLLVLAAVTLLQPAFLRRLSNDR